VRAGTRFSFTLPDRSSPSWFWSWIIPTKKSLARPGDRNYFATTLQELFDAMGFAAGVTDYVTKPFKPAHIRARVHVWLRRKRAGAKGTW